MLTVSPVSNTVYGMRELSNTKRKPKIAYSTWRRNATVAPYGQFDLEAVSAEYLVRVQNAGGLTVLVPHGNPDDVYDLLDGCDGLVLVGGDDIDPSLYGEENCGASVRTDPDADRFEVALIAAARERRVPTLAICRGMQLLNVALGGTLVQDLPQTDTDHVAPAGNGVDLPSASHDVEVVPGGNILNTLYGSKIRVNSIHHQAIGRSAEELEVIARAPDGVVEGIQAADSTWPAVGVQWHPEKIENGVTLFDWVVAQARERMRTRLEQPSSASPEQAPSH